MVLTYTLFPNANNRFMDFDKCTINCCVRPDNVSQAVNHSLIVTMVICTLTLEHNKDLNDSAPY